MVVWVPLLVCLLGQAFANPVTKRAVCNGSSALCDRSYGNVTFLGSHDSYAISTNPLALGRNQEVSLTAQLDLGVRLLQGQAHLEDNELRLCHTSCALFDGGLLVDYLKTVKSWLDSHTTEVLTLLITNPDSASLTDKWKPAFDSAGLTSLAYVPSSTPLKRTAWPTLGTLINSGKRLVVFLDYGADVSVVNFLLPEFTMIWEPPYDSTDSSFPCSVDRTSGPLATSEHMYMLNHFLDVDFLGILIPDRDSADETNAVNSITANANGCVLVSGSGQYPNFVLLDWVNVGAGLSAVNRLNGV